MAGTEAAQQANSDRDFRNNPDGKIKLASLSDLDLRTRASMRARTIVDGIMSDLGGSDRCSTAERQLATRAALLGAMAEDTEVRWLRGEGIDRALHHSTVNCQRRVLASLGLARRLRDVTPDLQTYLRDKASAEASNADDAEAVA